MSRNIPNQEERKTGVSANSVRNEENFNESNYKTHHIVLLGATGAGKSTIVNAFDCSVKNINIAENPLFNPRIRENVNQDGRTVQSFRSVTSNCSSYEIIDHQRKEKFVILDTPGLDDTSGTDQDDINFSRILEHLCKMSSLQCIGLVMPASNKRITNAFSCAIKRLTSIIPSKYLGNIILIATNHGKTSLAGMKNLIFECTNIEGLKSMNVFGLTNGTFSEQVQLKNTTDEDEKSEIIENMSEEFGVSMMKIEKLKDHIRRNMKVFNIKTELTMLKNNNEKARIKLLETKNTYINLLDEKDRLEDLKRQILDGTKSLNDLKTQISHTQDLEWILQDVSYHNTICENCFMSRIHSVCHDHCGLEYTTTKNGDFFKGCACISNGSCTKCGCSSSSHLHAKKIPVCIDTQKTKTLQSQFKGKEDEQNIRLNLENAISTKIADLNNQILGFSTEIRQCMSEIREKFPHYNVTHQMRSALTNMENDIKVEQNTEKYSKFKRTIDAIKALLDRLLD